MAKTGVNNLLFILVCIYRSKNLIKYVFFFVDIVSGTIYDL